MQNMLKDLVDPTMKLHKNDQWQTNFRTNIDTKNMLKQ